MNRLVEILYEVLDDDVVRNFGALNPGSLIKALEKITVEEFDWDWIVNQNPTLFNGLVDVMYKLIDKGEFKGEMLYGIMENRHALEHSNIRAAAKCRNGITHLLPHNFFIQRRKARDNDHSSILIIENIGHEFSKLFNEFLANTISSNNSTYYNYSLIFEGCNRKRFEDFNDTTFLEDANRAFEIERMLEENGLHSERNAFGNVVKFYTYIQQTLSAKVVNRNFKKFTMDVLGYTQLAPRLRDGFVVTTHSFYEKPPIEDKLILKKTGVFSSNDIYNICSINFALVEHPVLRQWVKEFFWIYKGSSYVNNVKLFHNLFDFCNYIDDLFMNDEIVINNITMVSYRSYLTFRNLSQSSMSTRKQIVKAFIQFLISTGKIEANYSMLDALGGNKDDSIAYKDAFTLEEIEALDKAYKESCESPSHEIMKLTYLLCYKIFQLMRYTEIRKTSILNLRVDSLKKVLGDNGHTEYVLKTPSKTSGQDDDTYNITMKVKHIFDEILEETASVREEAPAKLKNILMIRYSANHGLIKAMSDRTFCDHHEKMCKIAGVEYKPPEAIRNFYMKSVSTFVEENNLQPFHVEALSRHSLEVHERDYVKKTLDRFAGLIYRVNVGDIDFEGNVVEEEAVKPSQKVANGYCGLESCNVDSLLFCIKCKNFVTTPNCLPEIQNAIKVLDEQIYNQPIQHEKEFLTARKELLIKCENEIIMYKEEHDGRH